MLDKYWDWRLEKSIWKRESLSLAVWQLPCVGSGRKIRPSTSSNPWKPVKQWEHIANFSEYESPYCDSYHALAVVALLSLPDKHRSHPPTPALLTHSLTSCWGPMAKIWRAPKKRKADCRKVQWYKNMCCPIYPMYWLDIKSSCLCGICLCTGEEVIGAQF